MVERFWNSFKSSGLQNKKLVRIFEKLLFVKARISVRIIFCAVLILFFPLNTEILAKQEDGIDAGAKNCRYNKFKFAMIDNFGNLDDRYEVVLRVIYNLDTISNNETRNKIEKIINKLSGKEQRIQGTLLEFKTLEESFYLIPTFNRNANYSVPSLYFSDESVSAVVKVNSAILFLSMKNGVYIPYRGKYKIAFPDLFILTNEYKRIFSYLYTYTYIYENENGKPALAKYLETYRAASSGAWKYLQCG